TPQVHVRAGLPGGGGAERARACAPHAHGALRALSPAPRAGSRRGAGGGRRAADHRLRRGDDRPVLHRRLPAAGAARGITPLSRFTSASVERVKDAADMVEIVSAYTDLRRVGERYSALCPFHEERTPSFSVDAREKLYYC